MSDAVFDVKSIGSVTEAANRLISAGGGVLFFAPGAYDAPRLHFTGLPVSIQGCGPSSVLRWPDGRDAGIRFNTAFESLPQLSVSSIQLHLPNGGTGIEYIGGDITTNEPSLCMDNVYIKGATIGVEIEAANEVFFRAVVIRHGTQGATGIKLGFKEGIDEVAPAGSNGFHFTGLYVGDYETGIRMTRHTEALHLNSFEIVNCKTGIEISDADSVRILNGHFDCLQQPIRLTNTARFSIGHCWAKYDGTLVKDSGFELNDCETGTIVANQISWDSPPPGKPAVWLNNCKDIVVIGNSWRGMAPVAQVNGCLRCIDEHNTSA